MVDIRLLDAILRAMPTGSQLVLVGDVDQLPSVGPGTVLTDIIESGAVLVSRLGQIFRQGVGSEITVAAHRILAGEIPESPPSGAKDADFYFIEKDDPEDIVAIMRALVAERIPKRFGLQPKEDVQVLTPMHRGPLGASGLNDTMARLLNPHRGDRRLAVGDKVMQVRNNYDKEVFNGDVGFIERLAADGKTFVVRFERRVVTYEPQDQDQLVPAWAITIHKSQGSEYPAVVIPVHTQHFMMLRRNLIYTAVTRGKRLVVLVGSRRALGIAVREAGATPRFGRLAERLKELVR